MNNKNDFCLQNPTSNLPEELIIINILPKLPIKSLLRFKIVSKKWNSSISSPFFAKLHFNQSSNNKTQHFLINHKTCFLSFDYENFEQNHENGDQKTWDCSPFDEEGDIISTNKNCVARILKSDFHFPNSNIFVIGSCNGLVCLHNTKLSNSLYLWNPTILALREVPYPESNPNPKRNQSTCLDAVWGFGYDSSTDDYKIVRLYQNKSNNVIEIQIFSTINNNWKSLQETCEDNWSFLGLKNRIGTYANNAIYWAYRTKVLNQSRRNYDYKEWCIIGFDLVVEKLMKVPLPESMSTGFEDPPLMFVTMEGNLGACWNIAYNVGEIGMFIKDEGIGKWIINVNGIGINWIDNHFRNYSILGMTKKGRFILYVNDFRYNRRFGKKYASCEFINYTNEEDLVIDLKLKCPLGSKNVITYVESLLSPFG